MDEGTLTDAKGRRVDFRNTIIVMTSNVGADQIKRGASLGFGGTEKLEDKDQKEVYAELTRNVMEQVRRLFRPEFLNRVDGTVIFRSLTRDEIKQIVSLELNKVRERLIEHAMTLEVTDEAIDWLAAEGYDAEYGARPLRRLIQNSVEDALSEGILAGKFQLASVVRVTVEDKALVLQNVEETEPEV
jgi:ATP-dependent Clp protease ATP-binding subunit ClpC